MIEPIDIEDRAVADRVVEIQTAAYAVEADLMHFDGIPQLHETSADVRSRTDLCWLGAYEEGELVGAIAWTEKPDAIDIDRLAVAPSHARRGHGRALVTALPRASRLTVSTGAANTPARGLYESLGYSLTAETEIAPSVLVVHYEKQGEVPPMPGSSA